MARRKSGGSARSPYGSLGFCFRVIIGTEDILQKADVLQIGSVEGVSGKSSHFSFFLKSTLFS